MPVSKQGTGTLIYSPVVEAYVATTGGMIDLSSDIISGQVVRNVDALSTFSLTINNKKHKYTGKLGRMNRIVIFLTKINRKQVFSGYLSRVPAFDLYPTTTTITGSCTLKRLMYTYWNPMLPDSAALIAQSALPTFDQLTTDSGVAQNINRLLTTVGSWDKKSIHIQNLPEAWLQFAKMNAHLSDKDAVLAKLRSALGFDSFTNPTAPAGSGSGGLGSQSAGDLGVVPKAPQGYIGPATTAQMAKAAGFSGADLVTVVAIAGAESGYQAWIQNTSNSDGSVDTGLFQVNSIHSQWSATDMKDPLKNAKASFSLYQGRGNAFMDWTTFNNGAYKSHMTEAQAGVDKMNASGSPTTTGPPPTGTTTASPATSTPTDPTSPTTAPTTTPVLSKDSADLVIAAAKSQLGKPYIWASPSDPNEKDPAGFDCSGLAMWCYAKAGIKLDHQTNAQYGAMTHQPLSKAKPGDLMFYGTSGGGGIHHVVIYIGNNQIIEAADFGIPVRVRTLSTPITSDEGDILPDVGIFSGTPSTGTTPGTAEAGSTSDPLAAIVFNAMFLQPEIQILATDTLYGGELSLINSEQLLNTVSALCKAGLRSFMSGPNGDFIAFYPDYFGLHGGPTKYIIEDIEMVDFSIQANDDAFTTHVFTAGDNLEIYGPVTEADWLNTSGVVSINQKTIFEQLIGIHNDPAFTPEAIYKRFGARPMKAEFPQIHSGVFEYFQALHLFMRSWAQQYSTLVSMTFMPDLYPGMRAVLGSHGVAVYIEQVTHNFSYSEGFTTTAVVSAPANSSGAYGLPLQIKGV